MSLLSINVNTVDYSVRVCRHILLVFTIIGFDYRLLDNDALRRKSSYREYFGGEVLLKPLCFFEIDISFAT